MLVNNAASFYAGFFEELTPEQMERQITTSLIGPMNVTRAVLPVMRKQRSGHVVTISSSAGFAGFEYGTAYAASKFGVDGWMESLAPEVEPFGIHTTVVNPGFFRTELLTKESTNYAPASIEDYAERNAAQREFWESMNGQQGGDPAKLAQALLTITDQEQPPFRFIAGADAIAQAEEKLAERQQQIDAYRELSSSLALDEADGMTADQPIGRVAVITGASSGIGEANAARVSCRRGTQSLTRPGSGVAGEHAGVLPPGPLAASNDDVRVRADEAGSHHADRDRRAGGQVALERLDATGSERAVSQRAARALATHVDVRAPRCLHAEENDPRAVTSDVAGHAHHRERPQEARAAGDGRG